MRIDAHLVNYDPEVNYEALQSTTDEINGETYVFYTCPNCGTEKLASFLWVNSKGETVCADCDDEI